MKKALFVLICVLLALLPAACAAPVAQTKFITIASGPIGGAFYPVAGGIADILNKQTTGFQAKVETTGGSQENPRLVGTGKSDLGITNANLAYFAAQGEKPYESKFAVTVLGSLHTSVFQIAVMADSKIQSVSDLKGKKVSVGPAGGPEQMVSDVLSFYGLTMNDIVKSYMPYEQASDQLADGNIDASALLAGYPSGAIQNLAVSKKIRLLPIDAAKAAEINKKYSYYTPSALPKGTYNGIDTDTPSLSVYNVLIAPVAMDNDTAYKITKTLYENLTMLGTYHASAKQITLQGAVNTPMPLHPGAAKYFKEKGLIK